MKALLSPGQPERIYQIFDLRLWVDSPDSLKTYVFMTT